MKHNIFKLEELKKIINIIDIYNIPEEDYYNSFVITKAYVNVLDLEHTLYFPITINEIDNDGGWYPNDADTRKNINYYVGNNPTYTYVLDIETYNLLDNKSVKVIIVENIMESVDKLYQYILKIREAEKILITGSVGKTSTVGLIENVIKDNVLRIYAKRITPVVLKNFIINYLTKDIKYIVLEAGLFHKHHVKYFSEELKPIISVCLNILPEHIGIKTINSIDDIVEGKLEVFRYAKYALLNKEDEHLKKVTINNGLVEYKDFKLNTNIKEVLDISQLNEKINLYVKTNLSKIQYQTAYLIGKILNIPDDLIIERLNSSSPKEKRVCKEKIYNHEIIFDGDVSGVARFSLFTDHFYSKAILVIRALTTNGEEEEDYSKLVNYFGRFDKVYIFNDVHNKEILYFKNVYLVDNHDFIKDIDSNTAIFYHYGSYYRKYSKFDLNNLEKRIS